MKQYCQSANWADYFVMIKRILFDKTLAYRSTPKQASPQPKHLSSESITSLKSPFHSRLRLPRSSICAQDKNFCCSISLWLLSYLLEHFPVLLAVDEVKLPWHFPTTALLVSICKWIVPFFYCMKFQSYSGSDLYGIDINIFRFT